jgi:hypothetical protein
VTRCRYCAAENIVGIDLRPSVDQARAEQSGFDDALRARRKEKRLWMTLSVVATVALLGWAGGTAAYISTMVELDLDEPAPVAQTPPTATATGVARPAPRPAPAPVPPPTHHGAPPKKP